MDAYPEQGEFRSLRDPVAADRAVLAGPAAVADELDRAESTASNHLRKAESRVIRRLVRPGSQTPV